MMTTAASDHDVLRNLIQHYGRAADGRDQGALRALFHPDATLDGVRGQSGVDQWLDGMAGPPPFPTSMHMLGDPLIELSPDGESARLDTYAVVYMLGDGEAGQKDMTLGMRYLDRAVRSGDGWVFMERKISTIWAR